MNASTLEAVASLRFRDVVMPTSLPRSSRITPFRHESNVPSRLMC